MISIAKQEELRALHARGERPSRAAAAAGVSEPTARRYFKRFADGGEPYTRRAVAANRHGWYGFPAYTGPDWIG